MGTTLFHVWRSVNKYARLVSLNDKMFHRGSFQKALSA